MGFMGECNGHVSGWKWPFSPIMCLREERGKEREREREREKEKGRERELVKKEKERMEGWRELVIEDWSEGVREREWEKEREWERERERNQYSGIYCPDVLFHFFSLFYRRQHFVQKKAWKNVIPILKLFLKKICKLDDHKLFKCLFYGTEISVVPYVQLLI